MSQQQVAVACVHRWVVIIDEGLQALSCRCVPNPTAQQTSTVRWLGGLKSQHEQLTTAHRSCLRRSMSRRG